MPLELVPASTDLKAHLVGECPLFQGTDSAGRAQAANLAVACQAQRRDRFCGEGEPAESFGFVYAGRLKLSAQAPDGRERLIRVLVPGQVFGVLGIAPNERHVATAAALEPSLALIWNRQALVALFEQLPALPRNALRLQSRRLREREEGYRELATEPVSRRLARTLLRLVHPAGRRFEDGIFEDVPLSRADLAQLTGASLFTVSRILSDWDEQGILSSRRERVVVEDPRLLAAIAQLRPVPST